MRKNNKFYKVFIYYLFVVLGALIFMIFMYINFIRERLPKTIPINLTEVQFFILLSICLIYIYAIKNIIYPKPLNESFQKIIDYITTPFIYFDSFFKYHPYIYKHYTNILNKSIHHLDEWHTFESIIATYLLQIVPRIILVSIFLIDVFKLHNINIFYYFIILGIFPLFYRYCKYSLVFALEQYIQYLENIYDEVRILEKDNNTLDYTENAEYHNTKVTIREYIKIQINTSLNYGENNIYLEYEGYPCASEKTYEIYCESNNITTTLTEKDYDNIRQEFYAIMPLIIKLYDFLERDIQTNKYHFIPTMKVAIYLVYLICWCYILFVSIHTIQTFAVTLTILNFIISYYKIFLTIKLSLLYLGLKFINKGNTKQ